MEKEHILQAIQDLENGLVNFNNGLTYCFLFDNKWYPIHAIVNRAKFLTNDNAEYNLHYSILKLHNLLNFIFIEQIHIENQILGYLSTEEKLEMISNLADKIKNLSN